MKETTINTNRKIAAAQRTKEAAYWKQQLAGGWEKAAFPFDPYRETNQETAVVEFDVPAGISEGLERIGRGNEMTINVILLAGLQALLRQVSGQEDIMVGQPILKQEKQGALLNHTLLIRTWFKDDLKFKDLLLLVRQQVLAAIEHQNYPLDMLLDELDVRPTVGESPFVDVGLELKTIHDTEFAATVPLKMLFSFDKSSTGRTLQVTYSTASYWTESVNRIVRHYFLLMEQGLADVESQVTNFSLLGSEDRIWLDEVNATQADFDQESQLIDLFEQQVALTPDKVAVIGDGFSLTYGQLNERANRLARVLRTKGIGANQLVAVMTDRSPEMMVAIYGIMKAGAAYLPIDPTYPQDRIEYLLLDSQAQIVLTQGHHMDKLPTGLQALDLQAQSSYAEETSNLERNGSSRDMAYVIYTSGSTGKPKGAIIEHRSAINRIAWMQKAYPIGANDVILQKTPISFDVSVWELFWWMFEGATVCLLTPGGEKDPDTVLETVETYAVTTMHFVPSMLNVFLDYVESSGAVERLGSLRQVFASGEALGVRQVQRFNELLHKSNGAKLINLYGPTEATVDVSHYPCSEGLPINRTVPIGKPIDNIRLYILDDKLRVQPAGVAGELCIAGVGLARGYLNREELTKEKFVEHPFDGEERIYRTGDLARLMTDGNIEYLGRLDHQVKVRGYRIELGEIEENLLNQPEIKDAVVIAREGQDGQKYLVGYAVQAADIDEAELKNRLNIKLPEFMVPTRIVFLDQFPLSPNGKLDRKALPEPKVETAERNEYIKPRNRQEEDLAKIISEVLDVEQVGITDDFFTLGGNSIHFISVLSKARAMGYRFTFQQFFQHPTIDQLVQHLGGANEEHTEEAKQEFAPFELLADEDRAKLPDDLDDAYPMSMLQEGLIFQSTIASGSAMYHDILGYLIQGTFHQELFEEAVSILVSQNPMFRTSYHLNGFSRSLQMVHKDAKNPLHVVDLRGMSEEKQDEWYDEFLKREKAYRFNWEEPGLIRFHVQILSDDLYRYNISFHDSALDGWSINLTHTNLFEIYFTLVEGRNFDKPALDNHFRNFVGLEQAALQSEKDRHYWKNILEDAEYTAVPRWNDKPASDTPKIRFHSVDVSHDLSDKIIQLASKLSVPVKNVLMAAHVRVLSVLSGQQDVLTGYEHSGRPELEHADKAIGLFLNTIPFRVSQKGGTWESLIRDVYEREVELLPHRRYPMAQMKQDLGTQNLLFETVFNFTYFYILKDLKKHKEFSFLEVTAEAETEFVLRAEYSQHFFTDEVKLNLHYHENLFEEEQIELIGGYYRRVMELMVEDSNANYQDQTLLSAAELDRLMKTFNDNQVDIPSDRTFHQLFEEQVAQTPEAVAVTCGGVSLTYDQLNRKANQIARTLCERGLKKENVVAVVTERTLDWAASVLAIFKAGGVYLPVEPQHPIERIVTVLEQSNCQLVLTEQAAWDHVREAVSKLEQVQLLSLEEITEQVISEDNLNLKVEPDDLAYIIFTSGSTGLPKGAMIEHKGMLNHLYCKVNELGVLPNDRIVQNASQCFDISVWQLLMAWLSGGTTVILPQESVLDAERFVHEVIEEKVTVLEVVPSYLDVILTLAESTEIVFEDLHTLLVTGEAVKKSLIERWFALYPSIRVVNAYGPTEASDDITHHIMTSVPERELVPVGKPVQNMNIYVLDEFLVPVPLGTIGEVAVGGIGVGRGYINNAAKTQEAFLQNPFSEEPYRLYKTGDFGRWLPDGTIEYLGRKDDQVKIRGFRIELGEIESQLLKHAGVKDAAIVVKEDKERNKSLVAYYVSPNQTSADELRKFLTVHLPDYMVPAHLEAMDRLPTTSNGKTDRKKLTQLAQIIEQVAREHVPPTTEWEHRIAALWADVLNLPLEEVGKNDNFFAIGGNSLLAMKIAMRSDGRVSLVDLMKYPELAQLAAVLEDHNNRGEDELLIELARPAGRPDVVLICFPYAAGNAINFKPLADELARQNSNLAVLSVELPGHNLARPDQPLLSIEETARLILLEIKEKVDAPILLWGHCSGTALALEVAKLLEMEKYDLRHIFLGGRILRDSEIMLQGLEETERMTNEDIKAWMIDETGYREFEGLKKAQSDFLAEAFRHDAGEANRYFYKAYDLWQTVKLSCPITNVASTTDKLTVGYEEFYLRWNLFAEKVDLCVVEQGGHYFIQSEPAVTADVILEKCKQISHV